MEEVKADVKLRSYTLDEEGKETINESGVFMIVSMVLGMIIYMFIVIFGGMVMSSVIEEKSSRVVEVLVSSVKATELMFGKIIGIALVAITQFLLWVVLTAIYAVCFSLRRNRFRRRKRRRHPATSDTGNHTYSDRILHCNLCFQGT